MAEFLTVDIWRGGAEGQLQRFDVPRSDNQTVLDVVTHVQKVLEPSLAYRFACRVGMCGSCAMMVNGKARWTCRTHVKKVAADGRLTLEPLANLPRIRDLVADLAPFFDKWQAAGGQFKPQAELGDDFAIVPPSGAARRQADEAIECIGCAVCYASCDVVAGQPDYLGPAALNRAWTLMNDGRDGAQDERLKAVSGAGGCQNCHTQQGCRDACPKGLNPTRSIAGLKRMSLMALIEGRL
ncbi:succinate dehydrogenase/fumarate reductase iron-sulfur subunit [Candidatus Raskinella chloraquaticus]|jgi:fumarate reductase iron-sulfur subunit|uniref:Succinate dehydrogenase iron-sulfur subunit n=1 Tax=Candidatus Raskinella chloraquaticus TaxID=1951219 RepID=A0A1W9HV85_9HYPH|nr:MAG: fumarate reductase [Proteobacteria bacterium SG_bin8]